MALFLVQRKPGIWTWETLPSLVGLKGFLTWFHIPSRSSFGAGLWFFTLLWMFYVVYPLLSRAVSRPIPAAVFIVAALAVFSILHYRVEMGHELWMTALAFAFGVYSGRYRLRVRAAIPAAVAVAALGAMFLLNWRWGVKTANYALLLLAGIAVAYFLTVGRLGGSLLGKVLVLSGCVMELYFVHTYVFVHPVGWHWVPGYALSMAATIAIAFVLAKVGDRLKIGRRGATPAPVR